MSEIAQTDNFNDKTNIKVVGVGGAGGNAVNRMIAEGLQNVEFVAVNTDAKDLLRSDADVKISLSDKSSRGLGAGADPERGAKAAQDHQSDIEEALRGADMVFVTCGADGCYFKNSRAAGREPALPGLRITDTTGAGDIFGGSAVWKLLRYGVPPEELGESALRDIVSFACAAAGLSATRPGGISSIPEYDEVLRELNR